jgi:hypothetical protein
MWMPEITGIALLTEMKRRRLSLPVIIMSGDDRLLGFDRLRIKLGSEKPHRRIYIRQRGTQASEPMFALSNLTADFRSF